MLDTTMTPVERLAAIRSEIAPIAARLGEVEAELAGLADSVDPADLAAALEARKVREGRKRNCEVELTLLKERLTPLREQESSLAAEVREIERRAAADQFEADMLHAVEVLHGMANGLLDNVEVLRGQLDMGRSANLRQSVKMRDALGKLSNTISRTRNTLNGGMR